MGPDLSQPAFDLLDLVNLFRNSKTNIYRRERLIAHQNAVPGEFDLAFVSLNSELVQDAVKTFVFPLWMNFA